LAEISEHLALAAGGPTTEAEIGNVASECNGKDDVDWENVERRGFSLFVGKAIL